MKIESSFQTKKMRVSLEVFLDNNKSRLDENAPLKLIDKFKLNFKTKTWMIIDKSPYLPSFIKSRKKKPGKNL